MAEQPDSLSIEEVQRRRAAAAPDSLSVEEVQERLRGPKFGEAPALKVGADILKQSAESLGRRSLDAFSLGLGDEIIAGAQAAFGADYEEALAASEPRTQAFQQRASDESALGFDPVDVAGLATGGGAAFSLARMLPGISRLPGLARSAFGGGTVGGIAAGAQPGSVTERVGRVPYGAAAGAAIGPAAQLGARGVGAVGGALYDLARGFTPAGQRARGLEAISRAAERGGTNPQIMAQDLQRMGPQAIIADVGGPNVRSRAQQSQVLEGPGRDLAQDVLTQRNLAQSVRVSEALREATGEQRSFVKVFDDLDKTRKATAAPLYDQVREQVIQPTERMRGMFNRRSFQNAYKKARDLASEDGVDLPTLKQLQDSKADITGLETWDYIKRGLDEYIGGLRTTPGMGPAVKRAANQTRKDLLEDLDALYPPYAQARAAYAGPSRSMELMEDGKNIFDKRSPEEFARDFGELTDGEKDFFRLGVVEEITRRIGERGQNQNALGAFWNKPNQQQKLAVLFPQGQNMTRFMDRVIGEEEAMLTAREVLGRSPTADIQARAEQSAIESAPGIVQAVRQGLRGDVGGLVEGQARRLAARNRLPPAQRTAEAEILFEPDRQRQLQYLQELGSARGPVRRAAGAATQAGAAGLGAGAAGRNQTMRDIARFFIGGS